MEGKSAHLKRGGLTEASLVKFQNVLIIQKQFLQLNLKICILRQYRRPKPRRRKLHLFRFAANSKAHSFHCSSSPHKVYRTLRDPDCRE